MANSLVVNVIYIRAWSEHTDKTCAFYAQNKDYRVGTGFKFSPGAIGQWDFTVYGNKGGVGLFPKFILHLGPAHE